MKAPAIRRYLSWLKQLDYRRFDYAVAYDEASYPLLDTLFELVEQIVPTAPNGARELWLRADRGTSDDYAEFEEMVACGEVADREEFEQLWKMEYPEEIEWFHFGALEDKEAGYRCVFVDHRLVLEDDLSRKKSTFPYDVSEFIQWLVNSIQDVIAALKREEYNLLIENELPAQHRVGTIKRKDLWDVYPDRREEFLKNISREDIAEFVACMHNWNDKLAWDIEGIRQMTAADFYRFCALGYEVNQYEGCELSPKEQYKKHADGRDEGLCEIDAESPEAFLNWYQSRRLGGHPWEVCRGGNSTHISLYVHRRDNAWYLSVAGDAWNRTVESVKFYLALYRAGLPVYMHNGKILAKRLLEEERIGIVPQGIFPAYCSNYFPDEDIIDYINLPRESREKLIPFCTWQKIQPIMLVENND